jgi:hypothetical protein
VPDARSFRLQAHLCLLLAHQISDSKDADHFRGMAQRYVKQALALENGSEPTGLRISKTADE